MDKKYIKITFRVTENEKKIIEIKAKKAGVKSISSYLRRIAVKGIIVNYENQGLLNLMKGMRGIQTNVNQIAMRVNSTNRVYDEDFKYLKKVMKDIWQQLESIQSSLHSICQ
ncbi:MULTISPECIES: plasmid mobilization relaxosome protein MobC [unclassified Ruminococcus]|uniref:plasmid mobilization protein n=1 Tax=unclassified Ruminococcus TaxID=2608920 RepID=UPI00210D5EFB|nr:MULTISPECIES: plasmid mobilization relaxosome protein MobC [unclassified Ruminococcus]MCQ4021712.1 plasmid mobilization relaxosome protein MobC [Ruminococcus sp. zg-924]MCQ4114157.1 plasmid mobilization relaxosome protein MobC [Ruminococcus sp. zg-921]